MMTCNYLNMLKGKVWGTHLGRWVVQGVFEQLVSPHARPGALQGVPVGVLVKGDVQRVRYVLGHFPQRRMAWGCGKHPLTNLHRTWEWLVQATSARVFDRWAA